MITHKITIQYEKGRVDEYYIDDDTFSMLDNYLKSFSYYSKSFENLVLLGLYANGIRELQKLNQSWSRKNER